MVDDTVDFNCTRDTLLIPGNWVERFQDDAYGAMLGLIHWEELTQVGRQYWQLAQEQIIEPLADHFFERLNDLERRAHNEDHLLARYEHPWSLTDPDFLFCRYQIVSGRDITPDEFQERFLSDLRQVSGPFERLTFVQRTSDFLAKGSRGGSDPIPPRESFLTTNPEHNRLTNVDWAEVKNHLALSERNSPGSLREKYDRDANRRQNLRNRGLSSYFRIVGPRG